MPGKNVYYCPYTVAKPKKCPAHHDDAGWLCPKESSYFDIGKKKEVGICCERLLAETMAGFITEEKPKKKS